MTRPTAEGMKKSPIRELVLIPVDEWNKVKKKFPTLNDHVKSVKLNTDDKMDVDLPLKNSPPPSPTMKMKPSDNPGETAPPPLPSPPPSEGKGKGGEREGKEEVKIDRQHPPKKTTPPLKRTEGGIWRPPGKMVKGVGVPLRKTKKKPKKTNKWDWISL